MSQRRSLLRRIVRAIGPWPFRPLILGGTMWFIFVVAVLAATSDQIVFEHPTRLAIVVPPLIGGVCIWAVAALGRAWQIRHGIRWPSYIAFTVAIALVAPVVRSLVATPAPLPAGPMGFVAGLLRVVIPVVFITAVTGNLTSQLEGQVAATQRALDDVRDQQRRIIAADEEARRQAALLLHDRVQASLITTCMELRGVAACVSAEHREAIDPLIDRLEQLRALDLLVAIRSLSPNLEDVDLQTAIEEVALQYESAMLVDVDVDPVIDDMRRELGQQCLLACYRIVEQGLINAAAHANCTRVDIAVTRTADGLDVHIADDGVGVGEVSHRGLGSAIVDAWVEVVGGSWELRRNAAGRGTVLTATLRATGEEQL